MRALVLALALVLVAPAAWAGIVPSFGGARVDSFQQGVWPDANFSGCEDAQILHGSSGGVTDSINVGGQVTSGLGGVSSALYRRALERWTFGSYLPAGAVVDSVFEDWVATGSASLPDTVLCAAITKTIVFGTGDGTVDAAADSSGVSWKYYNRLIAAARAAATADSAWLKAGGDSAVTTFGGVTMSTPMSQSLLGKLAYDGNQDHAGQWWVVGIVTGTGTMRLNVTEPYRWLLNSNRARAYGLIFRLQNETAKRFLFNSSEAAVAANRPKLVIYYHDTRQPVIIGGGQ